MKTSAPRRGSKLSPTLSLACALVLGAACSSDRPTREIEPPPEVLLRGVRMTYFEGAEKAATARAARFVYHRSSGDFEADEGFVRFPAKATTKGPVSGGIEIRGKKMSGNVQARRILGEGDVRMRSGSGMRGQTERAQYDGLQGFVEGTQPVLVQGTGYTERAERGFRFDLNEEQYVFRGPSVTELVSTRDPVPGAAKKSSPSADEAPPEKLRIHANTAFAIDNKKNQKLTWNSRVKVTRGETELWCDRLDAFLVSMGEKQAVDRIECEGNVDATRGTTRVRGEKARFDNATGVMVLTGSPFATSGPNEMHGDEVRFDTERDVVVVLPARTIFQSVPDGTSTAGSLAKATAQGAPVQIDSDRFVLENRKRTANWTGKVRITRASMRMTCGKLEAAYTEANVLDSLLCSRGVVAVDKDMRATGNSATYNPNRDHVILKGDAVLTKGPNVTRSPRIEFYPGKQEAKFETPASEFEIPKRKTPRTEGSGGGIEDLP